MGKRKNDRKGIQKGAKWCKSWVLSLNFDIRMLAHSRVLILKQILMSGLRVQTNFGKIISSLLILPDNIG